MSWCKCPGVPRGQPLGMAADKCITQIYLYRWCIPDLIRLANDMYIETNPFPAVVDNIDSSKTVCASYSSSNILSSLSNSQFF